MKQKIVVKMADIEGDIIRFKSYPVHFIAEQMGVKRYTARERSGLSQDGITVTTLRSCKYIEIKNVETGKTFRRRIKTVLPVGTEHIVFSW